jgi:hypothetical protein
MATLARGRTSFGDQPLLELVCCTASMHSGLLLEDCPQPVARERLGELAATLPELFGTLDPSCLDRISEGLGDHAKGQTFAEIVLLSDQYLHVIQPLRARLGVALLAVSPCGVSVGLVLSEFHARVAALEDK